MGPRSWASVDFFHFTVLWVVYCLVERHKHMDKNKQLWNNQSLLLVVISFNLVYLFEGKIYAGLIINNNINCITNKRLISSKYLLYNGVNHQLAMGGSTTLWWFSHLTSVFLKIGLPESLMEYYPLNYKAFKVMYYLQLFASTILKLSESMANLIATKMAIGKWISPPKTWEFRVLH